MTFPVRRPQLRIGHTTTVTESAINPRLFKRWCHGGWKFERIWGTPQHSDGLSG